MAILITFSRREKKEMLDVTSCQGEKKSRKVREEETLLGGNSCPKEFRFVGTSRDVDAAPSLERKCETDVFPLSLPRLTRNDTPPCVCAWTSVCVPYDNMENSNHCGGFVECSWFASPCYTHPLLIVNVVMSVCSALDERCYFERKTDGLRTMTTTAAFSPCDCYYIGSVLLISFV